MTCTPRRAAVALCVLGLCLAAAAEAGRNRWTSSGPEGALVVEFALHPRDPEVVFAAPWWRPVLRSSDGGRSWTQWSDGFPPYASDVQLEIDPSDPGLILAFVTSDHVFRSTDEGRTWGELDLDFTPASMACVAGDGDSTWLLAERWGKVQASTDGGATWERICNGIDPAGPISTPVALEPVPETSGAVYALLKVAPLADRMFRSDDRGATWTRVGPDLPAPASTLTAHPSTPGLLFAASSDYVMRSTDGGQSWEVADLALRGCGSVVVLLSREAPDEAFVVERGGLHRSTDGGTSWRKLDSLSEEVAPTAGIMLATPERDLLIGSNGIDGVFRSQDHGESWSASVSGLGRVGVQRTAIDPLDPRRMYAASHMGEEIRGLYGSTDGGVTWQGVTSARRQSMAVAYDPHMPGWIWAGGWGVRLSTDGGASWSDRMLEDDAIINVVADPFRPGTVFATGIWGSFRTRDCGRTWVEMLWDGNPIDWFLSLAADPVREGHLYAGSTNGLMRSTDRGETWSWVADLCDDCVGADCGHYRVRGMAASEADRHLVFVAVEGLGVAVSHDGGESWTVRPAGIPITCDRWQLGYDCDGPTSVAPSPLDADVVWAGTGTGVYVSRDRGASWEPFGRGLEDHAVSHLAIDATATVLVASTEEDGVFTYHISAPRRAGGRRP